MNTVIRCRDEYKKVFNDALMTMGEWVCDVYGGIMTYQLTQSFFSAQKGFFTDMFRYTFPEFGLMDMVYPKNVLMRPPQFAAKEEILATAFANGSYLWLYHVGEDINFFRDEKSLRLIQDVNSLNKHVKQKFADYRYVDTDGVTCDETVARVRRFQKENHILLKAYRYAHSSAEITIPENIRQAWLIMPHGNTVALPFAGNTLQLPDEKVCLISLVTE